MVDDMADAGLIQKDHCEPLRKDTNSLASYFNSNTRANLLWLGLGRGNLTGCHRQPHRCRKKGPAASASSPCRKRLTSVSSQKTADVSRPIPCTSFQDLPFSSAVTLSNLLHDPLRHNTLTWSSIRT